MDIKETGEKMIGRDFVEETRDKNSLKKDDFMKLLLTQMQHQDPLSPMESTDYISQLAELTSLEELQNIHEGVQNLAVMEAAGTNSQTVNYIGKNIKAVGSTISVGKKGDVNADMYYSLEENAKSVDVTIKDEDGNIVRTIKNGPQDAGEHSIVWDGRDNDGNLVPSGKYSYDVAAVGNEGEKINSDKAIEGKVTGVTYENGYPELMIGDIRVMLGDIISVDGENPEMADSLDPVDLSREEILSMEKIVSNEAKIKNLYNM
ncbi:MAG: FlgD immunoglobulin-like domain containing protein [bacterium]